MILQYVLESNHKYKQYISKFVTLSDQFFIARLELLYTDQTYLPEPKGELCNYITSLV